MKKFILFLFGLIPLVLGFFMNSWLLANQDRILPFKLIGFLLLAFWLTVGFISYKFEKSLVKSLVISHLPAILMLLLIMYQEMILGQYWSNLFGIAPQFYYLPLINLSVTVVGIFSSSIKGILPISFIAFLLMLGTYYLGNYLRKIRSVH